MGALRQHELPAESSGRQHGRNDSGHPGHHCPRRLSGRWSLRQTGGSGDITGCGHALLLVPAAISTFTHRYRSGVPGRIHRRHADRLLAGMTATFLLGLLLALVGNVLLGVAMWRSGMLPRWVGVWAIGPCVLRPWCGARPGHHRCKPANSDCGRPVDRDQRRLDRLGRPTPDARADRSMGASVDSNRARDRQQYRRSLITDETSAGGRACRLSWEVLGKWHAT